MNSGRRTSSELTLTSFVDTSGAPLPDASTLEMETEKSVEHNTFFSTTKGPPVLRTIRDIVPVMKDRAKRGCTKKLLMKRIPIISWLPHYSKDDCISDLVAGFTVGLTVIPQSLAYANVAGVRPSIGLYSSFLGCFLYTLFGSCKDVPVGPTAVVSLVTHQTIGEHEPEFAVLLCFLSGCVELLMGIFCLGFIIDFISGPVSSGFTSAAACIIITSQVKDVLGLQGVKGNTFLEMWKSIINQIHTAKLWDSVLGMVVIILLLLLRKMNAIRVGPKDDNQKTTTHTIVNKTIWLISTARNAILVVACSVIAYFFHEKGEDPFVLTGYIIPGLPDFKPPPFSTTENGTDYSFSKMISILGSGIIVVPLIALLEDIAINKAFSSGKAIDATQEMLSIGTCNILSSFVGSMPISGSLSRSAVNNASGVRTPFGGIYTGIIVLLALAFLTPYFYYIPKASLAGVIIAAVIFMVEFRVLKPMWRSKKLDLVPALATFFACLFIRLEIGILIGIAINVLFLLYYSARPSVYVDRKQNKFGYEYLLVTPDRCLVFPSVDYVRNLVSKAGVKQGDSTIPVVIDSSHIYGADFTAAGVVNSLIQDFAKRQQPIFFFNLKSSVVEVFEAVKPKEFIYFYNESDLDELLRTHVNKV